MENVCSREYFKRIHIFDTLFYGQLKETFKRDHIDEHKWRKLKKWFSHFDIFEKDYLIVPICQDDHWFAIVVCHPNQVLDFDEGSPSPDQSSEPKGKERPGIIVMDSLNLKNKRVTREVREFLDYEWRAKLVKNIKDFSYHNLEQYHPNLIKQTNDYDCGIFMLAYFRSFVKQPDWFYEGIRKAHATKENELNSKLVQDIHTSLSDGSRGSIRKLIGEVCTVNANP